MGHNRKALILFTRFPEPGATKTRLIPALGPDGAAALQRQLTEKALRQAEDFRLQGNVELEIHFEGGSPASMGQWLGQHIFKPQAAGTIGERMEQAFSQAFACGMAAVVLIGTDCPGITADILRQAFQALRGNDLVLGPALDGGYYLIGLSKPHPFLFHDIAWGTSAVLQQTLSQAQGLQVYQLPSLNDIDRPEDLHHFNYHPRPE